MSLSDEIRARHTKTTSGACRDCRDEMWEDCLAIRAAEELDRLGARLEAGEKLAKAVEDYKRSIEQLSLGSQGASDRVAAHVRASVAMREAQSE